LPSFGRYNLIYGWNGSGKTIISKLLRALEMRRAPEVGDVTLRINGLAVTGDRFGEATLPVRVFNRDFVAESVFRANGGDVPSILVVGKESVEKQKEAEQLKKKLAAAQSTLESARSEKQKAERNLDRYCIDRARLIKDTLRSPGANPYNNYDKSNFRDRAQKMIAGGDAATHRLSEPDREKLLAQHRATAKPKVPPLTYQLPALRPLAHAVSELLSATVVSAAIQSLKDDPALSSWVHQGLGLHQARHADRCLFCQQTLPKDRLPALEAHFSAEYEQFVQSVDEQIAKLKTASKGADELSLPNRAEFYDDLAADYDDAKSSLEGALESTKNALESLVQRLMNKKTRAFESCSLDVVTPEVDSGAVERVNEVIGKHNHACDDFEARAGEAREGLEADSVAGVLDDFGGLVAAVQASDSLVGKADAESKRLNTDIARLEREVVEHRQPAEELNEDLRAYLGHDELHMEVKDTGYSITRNGAAAQALSEGETTAIALLYFLKSLRDRRFDLTKGVVVLDDPVSSLDANALYLAFGLIRARTQHAAQLFILTHNFTFFRQVRNWFDHLKGQDKKGRRFYMLDCVRDGNQRSSAIRPLDPLLEKYESEYHYLFARVYREAGAASPAVLEESYILPNVARRLLEAFLAFRQPQVARHLWEKMMTVSFDEAKKLRILRFLDTHSHGETIGEPEHDPSLLSEARSVLKDLLEFIKEQDPAHYAAMTELVAPPPEEGDHG
jgi:wobble nucleotide-excising tRNase